MAVLVLTSLCAACGAKSPLRLPDVAPGTDVLDVADAADIVDVATDVPVRTYLGTEFFATSTPNTGLRRLDRFSFAVVIGNPGDVPANITISGGDLVSAVRFTVPPRSATTRALPWVDRTAQRTTNISGCGTFAMRLDPALTILTANGAYRIQSNVPVSAYQFNPLEYVETSVCVNHSYTNDASLLLPTAALTGNYLVLGHDGFGQQGAFVSIVGTSDTPTDVTIVTSTNIAGGTGVMPAGARSSLRFTLAQGQVLQLVAANGDLSGTEVRATRPVAVFSGHNCTTMHSRETGECCCDHIEEQLFPEDTWGREVIVTQLQDRAADERYILRIISRNDGNSITFDPPSAHAPARLNRGGVLELESNSDFVVRATADILVAQFMEGQLTTPGASTGDPAMVLEVPASQYRRDYSFVVPDTYTSNYVQITYRTGAAVELDGRAIDVGTPIAFSGWSAVRQRVNPGSHFMRSRDNSRFGIKLMGVAAFTSYAYPGGLDLSLMP